MSLVQSIKSLHEEYSESRRPVLLPQSDIMKRELEFMERDSQRLDWILSHTYLTEGGLDDLKHHPDYPNQQTAIAYYACNPGTKCERHQRVKVICSQFSPMDINHLETHRALKLELHIRGANAGVHYRVRSTGSFFVAEATPAILDCE